ncbi:hypothetical protein DDI_1751 [Dickeya dianthicola RNS04.9]|nr:hypothetical protein DDI_1751 [Dickeya dianthicola RNS04.9]
MILGASAFFCTMPPRHALPVSPFIQHVCANAGISLTGVSMTLPPTVFIAFIPARIVVAMDCNRCGYLRS